MPIYEYSCEDCLQIFEEWQKDFQDREKTCPVCGGTAQRLMSNTSFVLKGGGWYASGYSKDSGSNGQKPSAESTRTEATPAATTSDTSTSTAS
ncbi:MAG: zinc ribbon domain-containing protein [Desulfomicrobium sp.]|jgi:putative FmdB family regulatory protein|nr:zinc ribbon domain-containing protein [Desulfomicrobium sp.]NLV97676.1 zinc ribbon domain-containing protein [Desulfovibrionales bacterium]